MALPDSNILLIAPDATAARLAEALQAAGLGVTLAQTARQAQDALAAGIRAELLLACPDGLADVDGLRRLVAEGRALPLVLLTGRPELPEALAGLPLAAALPLSTPPALLLANLQAALRRPARAENHLDERYRSLLWVLEQGPLAIVVTDTKGRIEYANERFCLLTGYRVEELLGNNPRILKTGYTTPAQYAKMWTLLRAGKEWRGTFQNRKKNGELYWEAAVISPVLNAQGEVLHYVAVKENITERRAAELALQAALEREQILQRDIYHRTKNHLMQVMGMLDLQRALIHDPYDGELLLEVQTRVRSMALLNEFLYRSGDLQRIDFGDYARSLVEGLVSTYRKPNISLDLQFEPVAMDVNQVLPCGLIVTELVSNAIKHAFTEQAGGCITASLRREDQRYVLQVSDNGSGIAPGVNWRESSSMGIQLVLLLARQLNGELELAPPPGANFILTFPVI